jgi:hypothetical protein
MSDHSPHITLLQGTLEIGARSDAATLDYTTAMLDTAGTPTTPAGPFRSSALRVGMG